MIASTTMFDDEGLALLITAGASSAANAERGLREVLRDLRDAGVARERIAGAIEVGQAVRQKPANVMKETADILIGTRLSGTAGKGGCPAQSMPEGDSFRIVMLIAAAAAMAANCAPCLDQAIPALVGARVREADIRRAVEIGQEVKDRAARVVDQVGRKLTIAA